MKKYITFNEYLNMFPTSREGFNVDEFSRDLSISFLKTKQVNIDTAICTVGRNSCDIIIDNPEHENHRIAIEVKDRSYKYRSTDFGDHFCETIKLKSLVKRKNKGEFNKMWLLSVFRDGVITITNDLEHNVKEVRNMLCPETTTLGKTDYVWKECAMYRQDYKFYFAISLDYDNSKVEFYFQEGTPVNIDYLNQQQTELF